MKIKKKIIIALILAMIAVIATCNEAQAARVSSRSSIRSSSRVRTSSRPTSIKSSTKTYRPSNSKTVPRVTKPKSTTSNKKATSKSSQIKTNSSNTKTTTTSKNNSYTVKPKSSNTSITPAHYQNYSNTRSYSLSDDFLRYYALNSIFTSNKSVSERDLVKELEKKGYTKEEIDEILKSQKHTSISSEKTKENAVLKLLMYIVFTLISIAAVSLLICRVVWK